MPTSVPSSSHQSPSGNLGQVPSRIQSVDALRGLVMIIMALDHVRDFFHTGAMSFQPDNLTRTTAALFLTRWITHLCAPVFAFTMGLGAFLWFSRGRDVRPLAGFLLKRGLWLILLDLIVIRHAMFFSLTSGPVILSVLWMLGWSMIALAVLAKLPIKFLAPLSVVIICLHDLTGPIQASSFGSFAWIWNALHQPGIVSFRETVILLAYPLIPWFAVVSAGFCFGRVLLWDERSRRRCLIWLGVGLSSAFIVLRLINVYGDPQPWSAQQTPVMTVLSFLRTTKYPPSLQFLLMTLGPAMLIWAFLERLRFGSQNPLIVFGRVPLFYFIGHWYVIHALTYGFAFLRYGSVAFLETPLPSLGGPASAYPPEFGYGLPAVYGVWFLVVALMYIPCLRFARFKERRKEWWLSYL